MHTVWRLSPATIDQQRPSRKGGMITAGRMRNDDLPSPWTDTPYLTHLATPVDLDGIRIRTMSIAPVAKY
jgi:hypothetical protein